MTNKSRRALSGIMSGVLGMTAITANAQEPVKPAAPEKPAAPAEDLLKAPENVAAAPADAEKTASGLASIVLKKGTGTEKPAAADSVKVHYSGWQSSDGNLFDSSLQRGQPAEFGLNQVIKGWTEGLQLMVVGEKRRFWIPADLAYGDTPSRPGGPSGMLVFDVELLDITKAPSAPKDLVAPADAIKGEAGLATQILKAGEGDATPALDDLITFHFSGWKADGEFLASSEGQPNAPQDQLSNIQIKGWVEAIKLMKKGEKRRAWIPAALGFGENPPEGAPKGDLIFDFELIDFGPAPKAPEPPKQPKDPNAPEDVAAAPADARKTDAGVAYKVLKAAEGGESPKAGDMVEIQFSGWDSTGVSIGSSKGQPNPFAFPLDDAPILGWVETLKQMKVGESRRLWIPEDQTFEGGPRPGAPAGALTFDIELVSFKTPPAAPEAPADVAAAPADAKKTESGLAYKVLKKGTGTKAITENDTAMVHYTGWTTDGKRFDSSIPRDQLFPVNLRGGVIQGWLEGVKLMVEGEKTRFWIPADLAYGENPGGGRPGGTLVFDIEVFEVKSPKPVQKIEAVTPPIKVEPAPQKK
ncbi:FKBP-type peptidyl-prolyl cis-trans isomerase [Verrucomicrobiaceae bacterium 227]